METEQDKFLKDLDPKTEEGILDLPIELEKAPIEEKREDSDEMKLRNRREKRLAEKLQAERESSIRLAERLATITEARNFKSETEQDYLKSVEKIYGNATPEAVTATELLKSALKGMSAEAVKQARAEAREEQEQATRDVRDAEKELDSMVEEIEDENSTILNDTQKKGFFTLLERMSPKDDEGNVIHYADPHAVWEVYQSRTQKTDNRAKDLSSRSMVQSGSSKGSKLEEDVAERFLKENGII